MFEQEVYYNSFKGRLYGNTAREFIILRFLRELKTHESFLEIGCNSGHYLKKLKGKCKRIVGIDIDRESVLKAKKKTGLKEIFIANSNNLPFNDKEFDWVMASEVLEHIPDFEKALNEIKRVARKKILITIPIEKAYWWRAIKLFGYKPHKVGHVHSFYSKDIEEKMLPWKLKRKELVYSPFIWLNNLLKNKIRENYCIHSVMLFENP
jgi:ubiquinone/menaquinone biosynthesis C-methylase UbiE